MLDAADADGKAELNEQGQKLHFRLVLSPSPTPASALLAPRRLRGMDAATAEATNEIEVMQLPGAAFFPAAALILAIHAQWHLFTLADSLVFPWM